MDIRDKFSAAIIVIALLVGFLLIALALVFQGALSLTLFGGAGTGFVSAAAILFLQWYIRPRSAKLEIIEGHDNIYKQFRHALTTLEDDRPHTVLTVHSFPPDVGVEKDYDAFVTAWLRRNPNTRFVRVVISQQTARWRARYDALKVYYGLRNYQQFEFAGPPTLEMFLIDDSMVIISFSKYEVAEPTISSAIRLWDRKLCRLLAAYHRSHLQLDSHKRQLGRDIDQSMD